MGSIQARLTLSKTFSSGVQRSQRGVAFNQVDPDAVAFFVTEPVNEDDVDSDESIWAVNIDSFGAIPIPQTYEEAMASKFAHKWLEAMQREIRELLGKQTWEPVDVPTGRKCTRSRWVFAIKYNSDGTISRFKARFCVCGYSQIEGVDYDKSFSSTMRATTFRTLIALAAAHGLRCAQCDISNAFCQSNLDDADIWINPPRGFEHLCGAKQGLKLLKALYGAKQASHLWQRTLAKWLESEGFTRLRSDPCCFIKTVNGRPIIVGCYVDDCIILHDPRTSMLDTFLDHFLTSRGGHFEGNYLGELEWFLGVKVNRESNGDFTINQRKYINDLLDRFSVREVSRGTLIHPFLDGCQ